MSQSKINGEGNSNSNNKPLQQRSIRQYPSQSSTTVSYSESQSLSGQVVKKKYFKVTNLYKYG